MVIDLLFFWEHFQENNLVTTTQRTFAQNRKYASQLLVVRSEINK